MKGKIAKKITIFILHIYLEKKTGINFDTSGINAIKKSDIISENNIFTYLKSIYILQKKKIYQICIQQNF